MPRTRGAIGLVKQEFESDFWRWCHDNQFKPGAECAKLMKRAAEKQDVRSYVQLSAIMLKAGDTRDGEIENTQPSLLIVDRTADEPAAA